MKVSKMKKNMGSFLCLLIVSVLFYAPAAMADWNFGLGTGPAMLAIEGDIGFDSALAGPIKLDLDLDASDMSDLTDSAFGFTGYATDGKWMIQLAAAQLNLEGDASAKNIDARAEVDFDITTAELTVEYPLYKTNKLKLNLLGGLRYTRHELKRKLRIGEDFEKSKKLDNDWTDGVIGLSIDVPFYENWSWNTGLNAGYGGSEGTYTAKTGVTWRFYKGWSTTLYGKYMAVDFEEGSKGDSDWYLYDIDETYVGLAILYNW